MKTLLIAAALGVVLSAQANAADPKPMRTPEPAASPSTPADQAAAARAERTRYCVMVEPATGTRISQQVCQTRKAWLQEGFDPLSRIK